MFIRKTATGNKSLGEAYFTFRLVAAERTGKKVRQITLLNLDAAPGGVRKLIV